MFSCPAPSGGETPEPKVEQLMSKLSSVIFLNYLYIALDDELCMFCRQLKQNEQSEELLEQYRCEIQEFKLKQRKQRMKFENQLHQLIEQHKNLHSMFTPERLPDEIERAENTKCQLLSAGKYPQSNVSFSTCRNSVFHFQPL
uniref:Uncharacterized protein n=1 Tax=Seriola lalandi dorsalis TaxID=1841481 RepID=A0A3B4XWQ0_SERLL